MRETTEHLADPTQHHAEPTRYDAICDAQAAALLVNLILIPLY